ncbi:HNH endonuclease signature motif containing protein [Arthrobacter bambusae]|uniref:HNH endonuclease signature motif containing protein n=1 Tax=Arthrobacter bambusae TaxID=1338426 RepID=UPI002782D38C|nr:HNH endonuclease signature motif containing protein [Arthrobacter bambusae]MDQ0030430.1 hypothetical protein [Arthrobacter bambusae]MDQ0098347.1 hypothetical protein [Arthrobacter bambusae]
MGSRTGSSADNSAGAASGAALDAIAASVAVLAACIGTGADGSESPGPTPPADAEPHDGSDPLRDPALLHGSDPLRRLADACLDGLAEVVRLEARTAALKTKLAADYVRAARSLVSPVASPHERTAQELALVAEVACVLTVSERTAGAFLSASRALTTALPLTLAALQSGAISWQHARIMVEETEDLEPAGAEAMEAHFLDPEAPTPARGCPAGELVPARFRAKARTWRERHHPVGIEERHAKKVGDRRVEYLPDRDGMAWLSAHLPAATAAGIWERTTAAARALQGPHETRTLAQLRADITATWLLTNQATGTNTTGTPGGGSGVGGRPDGGAGPGRACPVPSPRAQVLVTVPVLALLGATDEPAMLDGYGPIPPSIARRLIADGADSFHRVLTDPRDGAPLEIGRTSYRLTKAQRQWLRLRDGKCPFPGCNNHSLDNEADHLLAWADGGTTGISNLGQPCPKHHRLKHRTGWTPTAASKDHPPGWTSPSRRLYSSEHQDWEPPHWPPDTPITDTDMERDGDTHRGTSIGPDRATAHQEHELPVDPFPDWHLFTAAHPWPDADDADPANDPPWPAPLNDPFPECAAFHDP